MKYIYVVTRIIEEFGEKNGLERFGTPIPNLGVHTSYKAARKHFKSVWDSRTKDGYYTPIVEELRDKTLADTERYAVVLKATMHNETNSEELRLEKWRMK